MYDLLRYLAKIGQSYINYLNYDLVTILPALKFLHISPKYSSTSFFKNKNDMILNIILQMY